MKNETILYFGEHVKIANFKQNWNIRHSKQQKYIKLIGVIVYKPLWEICKKIGHSDPIHMTQLGHLIRFPQASPIIKYSRISFLQYLMRTADRQCMVYYRNLWNFLNGNTWPLCVHTTAVIMHGRPLSSFLPYDKRLWNSYFCNNSIGFDNPRCMWNLVVYRGATLYPLWHRANLWAKVWVLYRTEFQRPLPGSIHTTNPNTLKLFVPLEVLN